MNTIRVKSLFAVALFLVFGVSTMQGCKKTEPDNGELYVPPIVQEDEDDEDKTVTTGGNIFQIGVGSYACYRIPGLVKCSNGDLLAFSEARKYDCGDFGHIDILMKRSTDGGKTWVGQTVVTNNGIHKCGDVAPILDTQDPRYPNGRLFLLYNTATEYIYNGSTKRIREAWYMTSTDNGETWGKPVNITTSVHRPKAPEYNPSYNFSQDWRSMVNGQGRGLQISKGAYKGRLYVAMNHSIGVASVPFTNYRSSCYYSDDHGETWKVGGVIDMQYGNESTAAELSDGSILQSIRYQMLANPLDQPKDTRYRMHAHSSNGGTTWDDEVVKCTELPTPVCQGCLMGMNYNGKYYVFFSHPQSQTSRTNMTVYASDDDGKTWDYAYLVESGAAAYSALIEQDANTIGLAYERGNTGGIVYKSIPVALILNSKR